MTFSFGDSPIFKMGQTLTYKKNSNRIKVNYLRGGIDYVSNNKGYV